MGAIGEVWGNTLRSVGNEVCRKVNVLAEDPRSVDRQAHGPTAIPRRVSRHRCRRLWSKNRPDQHERSRIFAQLRRVPWGATNLLLGNPPKLSPRKNAEHRREPKRYTYGKPTQHNGQADVTRRTDDQRAARLQTRAMGSGYYCSGKEGEAWGSGDL